MFTVFELMAFKHVAGISLSYDENTYDRQWTCCQTVTRFHIWVKEMFSNWIFLGFLEIKDESASVLI